MGVIQEPPASEAATGGSAHVRLVGVGSSAGGLEALEAFLGAWSSPESAAVVIAQHLSPDHPSLIAELLTRSSGFHVAQARDGDPLVGGVVLVAPPNHDVVVDGHVVRLVPTSGSGGPAPSIDRLFESIAAHWGADSCAVILSGTGSDGARGLRMVHAGGGLTVVQDPATARFDGMPRAAIEGGGADLVLPPDQMAGSILQALADESARPGVEGDLVDPSAVQEILRALKRESGIDFAGYRESTIRRQINRRMAIRGIRDVDEYAVFVNADQDESEALRHNLLVSVTSFFRDRDAFAALRERLRSHPAVGDPTVMFRIWVPGCATGEEVYSLAMLVADILGNPPDLDRRLRIFGTDLDEESLAVARRAVYPPESAAQIPDEYLQTYAHLSDDGVRISEGIRRCAVFARHNLLTDPPFPRLDLVSCRNTLIYFTEPLQRQAIRIFAFALKHGGLLMLGSAETVARGIPGFTTDDAEQHIFLRTGDNEWPSGTSVSQPAQPQRRSTRAEAAIAPPAVVPERELLEEVIRTLGYAFLILNDRHELVHVVGDVSHYCRLPEGRVTPEAHQFLRQELRDESSALLLLARGSTERVVGQAVVLQDVGEAVRMQVQRASVGGRDYLILGFAPEPLPGDVAREASGAPEDFAREFRRLERELLESQNTLHRSLEELQAVNEELEASSEELQASSEELQSSNEELQASNEELQATNEELGTLNEQLGQRGDDLERVNLDLVNIQESLSQGMIIVDRDLRVTRFTPLAVRLFALVDRDIGQSLLDIPTTAAVPGLPEALRSVLEGGPRRSLQTEGAAIAYLVQVLPYLSPEGGSLGAIVTLTDISELVRLRSVADEALAELQGKSDLLARQAAIDPITGLANRRYFNEVLEREVSRTERNEGRLALAVLDLDDFKEVNDTHGHQAGDVVLKTVGERIARAVRSTDVAGRLGGDEFGVVIGGYEHEGELDLILERLVSSVRQPVTIDDHEVRVSVSAGIALYGDSGRTALGVLRAADAAMYSAKALGGDRYSYFTPSMNVAADARRTLRVELDQAIEKRSFVMHYQPIVDTVTGEVVAIESLLRWVRGDDVVAAGQFIGLAEETGQIRKLGLLTFALIREDLALLRSQGHGDVLVAVNMSVEQLEDRGLTDLLSQWPSSEGLRGLVVEIVESVFLPDRHVAMEALRDLIRLGALTAIDDYGSGYSNMRLLESIAPHFIKLDRSFLSEQHRMESRTALIRSVVELSHVIGARVIAEGVEEEAQHQLLRAAGVDLVQGNAIAPPMPLAELLQWLSDRPS